MLKPMDTSSLAQPFTNYLRLDLRILSINQTYSNPHCNVPKPPNEPRKLLIFFAQETAKS